MKYHLLIEIILVPVIFAAFRPPPVRKDPFKYYLDKVRCTRRYSVGNCAEPVVPVWTYVPHLQNCSERLGCHSATISNRFPTLAMCAEKCKSLRDLYTILISETNMTNQLPSSKGKVNIGRRGDGSSDEDEHPVPPDTPGDPDYPAPPDSPVDPDYPEPSAAPAEFHTELVTEEESYGDAPPEVELWEG